jgi:hypothetical protein
MKHVQLFEQFINEANKQIEKAADVWWKSRMKGSKSWDAEDMDMFIDYLMDEELVADDELEDVRSDMERYVEDKLGYKIK